MKTDKRYIKTFNSIIPNIIENWCLCRYCHLYAPRDVRFGKWMMDLDKNITSIRKQKVKSASKRVLVNKQVFDILFPGPDKDRVKQISWFIKDRFKKERIRLVSYRKRVAQDCVSSLSDLVDVIVDPSELSYHFFIKTLIK